MVVIDLTKDGFIANVGDFEANPKDWKYIGSRPCLIDFHAPWCGYCKRLSSILDEFAKEFDGKIYIYKVDVCLLYTSPSPRDGLLSRVPSSA